MSKKEKLASRLKSKSSGFIVHVSFGKDTPSILRVIGT